MCGSELKNRQSISYLRRLPVHIEPIFTEPIQQMPRQIWIESVLEALYIKELR